MAAPPAKYKWTTLTEAIPYVRDQVLIHDREPRDVRDEIRPRIMTPFTDKSFINYVSNAGIARARKQLKKQARLAVLVTKKAAIQQARVRAASVSNNPGRMRGEIGRYSPGPGAVAEQTRVIAETILQRQKKATEKHYDRMEKKLEQIGQVVDNMKPTRKTIQEVILTTDSFDKLARRTFNIDEEKPVNAHHLNVLLIAGQGYVPPPMEATEADVSVD